MFRLSCLPFLNEKTMPRIVATRRINHREGSMALMTPNLFVALPPLVFRANLGESKGYGTSTLKDRCHFELVEWESCFNCAILYISSSISKKSNRHLESIKLLPRFQRNKNQASNLVSSPLYQQLPWHTRDYPCGFINYPRDYKLPEGSAKNLYQAAAPGEGHGVTR